MERQKDRTNHEEVGKEFEEKVLYINRSSKVVKGGKKFSFSALILLGNRKGKVGLGFAKANEVSDAIRKGTEAAKKNIFTFEMEGTTIPHEISVNWDGAKLLLKPAKEGTGIVAGSKVRSVLMLAGITDIVAKSSGSSNPLNQVHAIVLALKNLKNRKQSYLDRGLSVEGLKTSSARFEEKKLFGKDAREKKEERDERKKRSGSKRGERGGERHFARPHAAEKSSDGKAEKKQMKKPEKKAEDKPSSEGQVT
jgi:small subunit ribosomal protein S5